MKSRRNFLLAMVSTLGALWLGRSGIKGAKMFTIRRSAERGAADHGWLKSHHTFSFANYYDPKHMGFRSLRVINEDQIAGGTGFGAHPHRDMEIISYVKEGALTHQDSMGNKGVILPGEVQYMSAGTGVMHSEMNGQKEQTTKFFQIWIMPNQMGQNPKYGQKSFEKEIESKKLVQVISPDGRDGSIQIRQDAHMFISKLKKDDSLDFNLKENRGLWLQLVKGEIKIGNETLFAGDALSTEVSQLVKIQSNADSEIILFDLA